MSAQVDFWPPDRVAALQEERWARQREHVLKNSPFYRRLWAGGDPPRRLGDLARLPFTTKAMLRESQEAHPPFGFSPPQA